MMPMETRRATTNEVSGMAMEVVPPDLGGAPLDLAGVWMDRGERRGNRKERERAVFK